MLKVAGFPLHRTLSQGETIKLIFPSELRSSISLYETKTDYKQLLNTTANITEMRKFSYNMHLIF